jgi:hypothetical protein
VNRFATIAVEGNTKEPFIGINLFSSVVRENTETFSNDNDMVNLIKHTVLVIRICSEIVR